MSGPRAMRPVAIAADLLLILMGYLGGVGLEHALLSPDLADHAPVIVQATAPVASRAATYPAWGSPRGRIASDHVVSADGPAPVQPAAATLVAAARTNPDDLRLEMQRLARWQRPTEAPAGAHHYPAAGTPSAAVTHDET